MRALLAGTILAACAAACDASAAADAAPDSDPDFDNDDPYMIEVGVIADYGAIVRIAGNTTESYEVTLASEAEAAQTIIAMENLVDEHVATRIEVNIDCDEMCFLGSWSSVSTTMCAYASGELRFSSSTCEGASGFCVGDGFCDPVCSMTFASCGATARCGLKRLPWDLERGWLTCVAPGTVPLDAACTIDGTGVDDCAEGLICHEGSCRHGCFAGTDQCGAAIACEQVPGMSPGVGMCVTPP